MKINDFIKNKITQELLAEDLGGLKKIDPNFLSFLLPNKKKYQNMHLPSIYGRNTEVKFLDTKSVREAYNQIMKTADERKPEDANGLILRAGAQQILFVMQENPRSDSYRIILNADAYGQLETNPEKKKKVWEFFAKEQGSKYSRNGFQLKGFQQLTNRKGAAVKWLMNIVYNALKESDSMINFLGIYEDIERGKKQKERQVARSGLERRYTPEKLKDDWDRRRITADARDELKHRLEKFKAERAKGYKTPEEFLQAALKSGYVDKVNINGAIYEKYSQNIDLHALINGQNPLSSYIRYQLKAELSPEIQRIKQELKNYKDQHGFDAYEKKIKEYDAIMPPRSLLIYFTLQGGSIVPSKIIPSEDRYNIY